MKRLMVWCCLLALGVIPLPTTQAATIFESATLGPTGIPFSELSNGNVPGTNVSRDVFTGVRFQINQPVMTTGVGGHFAGGGTFFGAIVALEDGTDFPDSGDFTTDDFLGSTLLTFPEPSDEVFGDLSLSLTPGWYAMIFGSGLFNSSGVGAALNNNSDIGNPTYVGFQPGSGVGWINTTASGPNQRFVVQGRIVPEATSLCSIVTATFLFLLRRRPFRI